MPASDEALRTALQEVAGSSGGKISLRVISAQELGDEVGHPLQRTRNPIYAFECAPEGEEPFRAVGYTLALNGTSRPATRAEALGKAVAAGGGELFRHNPFLLVFDYVQERIMALSAAALFGAFAKEAAERPLPYSDSSSFSLTPSFANRTVTMYATVAEPRVWYQELGSGALDEARLLGFLMRVRDETRAAAGDIPNIVEAVKARLAAQPEAASAEEAGRGAASPIAAVPLGPDTGAEEIKIHPRIWRMILNAVRSSPAVLLVGPPGTGKTALLRQVIREFQGSEAAEGRELGEPLWATPDESWTARELVGGETISGGEIGFRPGWVLRAIAEDRWLVLDEANRADMDRIFGGLLTWLAGGSVSLGTEGGAEGARLIELGWSAGATGVSRDAAEGGAVRYLAGDGWRLLGTYNALDAQRVFRFGAALGRRFVRVPVPAPVPEAAAALLEERCADLPAEARAGLSALYGAHYEHEATRLGPALFLGVAKYVRAALADPAPPGAPPPGAAAADPPWALALAEGYLIHVGPWIANLEDRDREELRSRVAAGGGLEGNQWEWVSEMAASLA